MSANIINLSEHRRSNGDAPGFYLRREAARLALLAPSTVGYWNREGIIVPALAWSALPALCHSLLPALDRADDRSLLLI